MVRDGGGGGQIVPSSPNLQGCSSQSRQNGVFKKNTGPVLEKSPLTCLMHTIVCVWAKDTVDHLDMDSARMYEDQ